MKKILLTVSLVFLLCGTAYSGVGWWPLHLENRMWLFNLNTTEVTVSIGEYSFGPDTRVSFSPSISGFAVWHNIVSDTRIVIWTFVSPRWRYNKNYTTIWLQSGGQRLGLQMNILLIR